MAGLDGPDNDDALVGRLWTRRDVVRWLTAGGVAAGVAPALALQAWRDTSPAATGPAAAGPFAALPACVVQPEMTEGPYYREQRLERSDIRSEPATDALRPGVPLTLAFRVAQVGQGACAPLAGATIDVWHCDALGVYSGVADPMSGQDSSGQSFLRGWQKTDAQGAARFTTIYPGWYRGRAVHVHFKIRTTAPSTNQAYEFTSQLFFDEALTDAIQQRTPYVQTGARDTRNESDGIFQEAGRQMVLALTPGGEGYTATFDVGLDLANAETGRPDGMGRGRGGPGRGGPPPPGFRGRGGRG